ncbi:hypothetical protein Tco_1370202 [Tanacetum coccineum]
MAENVIAAEGPFQLKEAITIPATEVDIYTLINHHQTAKAIWDLVKELMERIKLTKQERESKLYDDFDRFMSKKRESIHSYYFRYAKLINDMNIINMTMTPIQINTKFMNHLQPEWSRFVTTAKQVKYFQKVNFDQLYAFLKQNENDVNEVRAMRQRYQDPLALLAHTYNPPPSYSSQRSQTRAERYEETKRGRVGDENRATKDKAGQRAHRKRKEREKGDERYPNEESEGRVDEEHSKERRERERREKREKAKQNKRKGESTKKKPKDEIRRKGNSKQNRGRKERKPNVGILSGDQGQQGRNGMRDRKEENRRRRCGKERGFKTGEGERKHGEARRRIGEETGEEEEKWREKKKKRRIATSGKGNKKDKKGSQ